MLFTSNTSEDIFTPIHALGEKNPFFTSHDPFPSDDFNSKINEKDRQNDHEDLFSDIDLTDFDFADLPMEEKDANTLADLRSSTFAEESIFLPVADDSPIESEDSSTLPWVAEELTVESVTTDDAYSPASLSTSSTTSVGPTRSRATRQHHLSLVERKKRKKGQNKAAAEKYRLKKRLERDTLVKREVELKEKNQALKSEFESLKYRLEEFKKLFIDVLQIPVPPN